MSFDLNKTLLTICGVLFYFGSVWLAEFDYKIFMWAKSVNVDGTFWKAYGDFWDRSLFSDLQFGGQDFAYIFILVCLILMIISFFLKSSSILKKFQIFVPYIAISAIFGAALTVRFTKTFFTRARPRELIGSSEEYTFSPLLTFGCLTLEEGFKDGSFISGHTSTMGILWGLPFIIANLFGQWWALGTGVAVFASVFMMGLGRVVHLAHWASDTLYGGFFMLALNAFLYYYVLCLQNNAYYLKSRNKNYINSGFIDQNEERNSFLEQDKEKQENCEFPLSQLNFKVENLGKPMQFLH
jgi:membrane-associated phospholipid phosphatase